MRVFTIKKRMLIIFTIITTIVVAVIAISVDGYIEERNRQREKEVYLSKVRRAIEDEFKNLEREYESYVQTINDRDYSYDFRRKYVVKVNKLLGEDVYKYEYLSSSTVYNFIEVQQQRKDKDIEILRKVAEHSVFEN